MQLQVQVRVFDKFHIRRYHHCQSAILSPFQLLARLLTFISRQAELQLLWKGFFLTKLNLTKSTLCLDKLLMLVFKIHERKARFCYFWGISDHRKKSQGKFCRNYHSKQICALKSAVFVVMFERRVYTTCFWIQSDSEKKLPWQMYIFDVVFFLTGDIDMFVKMLSRKSMKE